MVSLVLLQNSGKKRSTASKLAILSKIVTKGKKIGTYIARVAVRKTGSFNIKTKLDTIQGISYKYCRPKHKSDGYAYSFGEILSQKISQPKPKAKAEMLRYLVTLKLLPTNLVFL